MQCPVDTLIYRHTSREIKHDCLFPDANFPVWAQRQQFIKWGMSCRAVIRLLWTRSSSQTKDVKAGGGLPHSTAESLESGMKEMNAAANHSSLLTGSFSKALLAFHLPWRRGGWLASQHALGSLEHINTFKGFTKWKTSFKKICSKIMCLDLHYERI